jgi:hypothetical protein
LEEDKRSLEEIGKRGRAGLLKFPTYHVVLAVKALRRSRRSAAALLYGVGFAEPAFGGCKAGVATPAYRTVGLGLSDSNRVNLRITCRSTLANVP